MTIEHVAIWGQNLNKQIPFYKNDFPGVDAETLEPIKEIIDIMVPGAD